MFNYTNLYRSTHLQVHNVVQYSPSFFMYTFYRDKVTVYLKISNIIIYTCSLLQRNEIVSFNYIMIQETQ